MNLNFRLASLISLLGFGVIPQYHERSQARSPIRKSTETITYVDEPKPLTKRARRRLRGRLNP
jgi:hypothetical protein